MNLLHIKPKQPLYLVSATLRKGELHCDLCPFRITSTVPKLMDVHMERHVSGGWIGT